MDDSRSQAVALIRSLMDRDMALNNYPVWEILFNAEYYLEYGALPERLRGTVSRWW